MAAVNPDLIKFKAWEPVDTFVGTMAGCEYGVYSC
jgi:hypothetical protein